jgi:hypothetical protein
VSQDRQGTYKRTHYCRGKTISYVLYKVVQILPGRFVCKQVPVCTGHIWTTLYILKLLLRPYLSSMQCACAMSYIHLWPLRLYRIFRRYLINGTIFVGGGGGSYWIKNVFFDFVYISEQRAIISLWGINWLNFIIETECVYCEVRTAVFWLLCL